MSITTTYFLLPVLGFPYVLIIMGFAQCQPEQKAARVAYLHSPSDFPATQLLISWDRWEATGGTQARWSAKRR